MKIFISWSKQPSREIADFLQSWLKKAIQATQPWMSQNDIESGTRWRREIGENLNDTNYGLVVVTPENLQSEWLMYESGALAKSIEDSRVVPLVFDMKPSDIPTSNPLSEFQAREFTDEGIRKLLVDINTALPNETRLDPDTLSSSTEMYLPELLAKMDDIKSRPQASRTNTGRTTNDMVPEILMAVRELQRSQNRRDPEYRPPKAFVICTLAFDNQELADLFSLDEIVKPLSDYFDIDKYGTGKETSADGRHLINFKIAAHLKSDAWSHVSDEHVLDLLELTQSALTTSGIKNENIVKLHRYPTQ